MDRLQPLLQNRLIWAPILILILIFLDQLTKHWVLQTEVFQALPCLKGEAYCGQIELSPIFDFSMVWNRGLSFGLLQSEGVMRWVLLLVQFSIGCGFLVWLFRTDSRFMQIALAFVFSGAIGNVIDRARFGAVVDFIDFSDVYFIWVFNLADSWVTIGAILLIYEQLIKSYLNKSAPKE